MNDVGRPNKYDPDYHPKMLIELMSQGMTDVEVFSIFGISKTTFYRWLRDYKELKEAYEIGLPMCEASLIVRPLKRMVAEGNEKGYKALSHLARNKFGHDQTSNAQTVNNTQINIKNMQLVNSREEYLQLQEEVKAKLLELNLNTAPELIESSDDKPEE